MINTNTGYNLNVNLDNYIKEADDTVNAIAVKLRDKIDVPLLWGNVKERFIAAPASCCNHGNFVGGLLIHSLNVLRIAKEIWPIVKYNTALTNNHNNKESNWVEFVAFFHDLGKIGDDKNPMYTLKRSDWHFKNQGRVYDMAKTEVKLSHAELSVWHLMNNGIQVPPFVFQSIIGHDGQYVDSNKDKRFGESPLLLAVQTADYLSAKSGV